MKVFAAKADNLVQKKVSLLTLRSKIGVELYWQLLSSPEWMALMMERVCFSLKREPTPYLHMTPG